MDQNRIKRNQMLGAEFSTLPAVPLLTRRISQLLLSHTENRSDKTYRWNRPLSETDISDKI